MTKNEAQFAARIKSYLDNGSSGIRAGTAYRLQRARAAALGRLAEPEHAAQLTLSSTHGGIGVLSRSAGGRGGTPFWSSRALWAGILAIIVASVAYNHWQSVQQAREIEETDAAILSSDLPIDAYLDRGFDNWLRLGGD